MVSLLMLTKAPLFSGYRVPLMVLGDTVTIARKSGGERSELDYASQSVLGSMAQSLAGMVGGGVRGERRTI